MLFWFILFVCRGGGESVYFPGCFFRVRSGSMGDTLFKQPNDYSFVFVFKYTTYFITYNTNINMYFEGSVE